MTTRTTTTVLAGVLAAVAFAPSALAQEHDPGVRDPDASSGERTHDGFYFHTDAGFGYYNAESEGQFGEAFSGLTTAISVLLGGSPMAGLAVGGGLSVDYASSPTYSVGGREIELQNVSQMLLSIGPFVDFYPDPQGGLHFLGMVGWGGLETSVDGNVGGSDPVGTVFTLGAGYDFWISSEWSAGLLGRVAYASMSFNGVVDYTAIAPALLGTITYN